ncbi:hypothetical protein ACWEU6_21745 [Streptosporangium sandarakinum]
MTETLAPAAPGRLEVLRFDPAGPPHLVLGVTVGAPDRTLCGIPLHAEDTPTWTIGERFAGPAWAHTLCAVCAHAARLTPPGPADPVEVIAWTWCTGLRYGRTAPCATCRRRAEQAVTALTAAGLAIAPALRDPEETAR